MDIRKISIGPDYKSGAMHYILGQEILGGNHTIHLIKQDTQTREINVWIKREKEIFLWKTFSGSMPMAIEYNVNF